MTAVPELEKAVTLGPEMPEDVFSAIAALAHREAGLVIAPTKRTLVQSRISRRLRALGVQDFRDYLDLVRSDDGAGERRQMISALTTNVSNFFRENHHFETLAGLTGRLVQKARSGAKVRLWSAGCSSGQEPYSIAMTLLDADRAAGTLDIRILATDIDPAILEIARTGEYDAAQTTDVSRDRLERYFEPSETGMLRAGETLRSMVTFRELNLLHPWPMKGMFDVIFCRNVVIYFDEETQAALWPRFRNALSGHGTLFVGHSERLPSPATFGFEPAGVTTYRAIPSPSPVPGPDSGNQPN